MTRKLAYMAHPFGGDMANLDRAERWLAYLRSTRPELIILAPWIAWIRLNVFKGDDNAGLAADCVIVRECEVFLAVCKRDGSLSVGTRVELQAFGNRGEFELIANPTGEPPTDEQQIEEVAEQAARLEVRASSLRTSAEGLRR